MQGSPATDTTIPRPTLKVRTQSTSKSDVTGADGFSYKITECYGGKGGKAFDYIPKKERRVAGLRVWHNKVVEAVQLIFRDNNNGNKSESAKFGQHTLVAGWLAPSSARQGTCYELESGEYFTCSKGKIVNFFGLNVIGVLEIWTNKGKHLLFGGKNFHSYEEFFISAGQGKCIAGVYGGAGAVLDRLGFYVSNISDEPFLETWDDAWYFITNSSKRKS